MSNDVSFCPGCGAGLGADAAFVQEFWVAADRHFLCWCSRCGTQCTVILAETVLSHEPEH